MPNWLKDAYQDDIARREGYLTEAEGLGDRDILDMNEEERAAYENFQSSIGDTQALEDKAIDLLGQTEGADLISNFEGLKEQYGFDSPTDAAEFASGYDPASFESGYTGDRLTDLIGNKDFELDYTNNVVDSTLANMDRQAQRDALVREGQAAATGGISNTRAAVADAVSGNLHNMSRAQTEAELRDSAQRFGTESLFTQAGMLDESDQHKAIQDLEAGRMTDDAQRFLAELNLDEQQMAEASRQFGLNFDQGMMDMSQGVMERGADFDRSGAELYDQFADSGLRRGMSIFDLENAWGEKQRGLDQAQADAPRSQLDWLTGLMSGTQGTVQGAPTGNTQTETTQGNSALQNVLGIGSSLAGAFMMSDENVKHDIEDPEGSALDKLMKLGAKEYEYDEGFGHVEGRTSGLMAQDIEKAGITGAVVDVAGVKMVDPYPVLATVVQAVNELNERVG